ncbi:MAG: tRNA uridine-5-carboxymethylaminomethyl(34) synthesis enzyme MnmG [Phycisphaeraceae bacterium]|nr:MAG: tRNA uridine-5-carboxymethylaminomethyl(34) synthesis enzyme MnmG [Phycisphaeraceae bacterium]
MESRQYDVIVIGGGHAGAEAAWAAANVGARVALVTLDPTKIGVMSCNPAIGGLAKGQIVREIDAMGGLMGLATDATGIMFKTLNTSRGAAVHGPRAQCDKHAYAETVRRMLESREEITIIAGSVERIVVEEGRVVGVEVRESAKAPNGQSAKEERRDSYLWPFGDLEFGHLHAPSVVLTTGTFMRGLMHEGESQTPGGRVGEAPSVGISAALREMSFELGRLKTGTPPRLKRGTIDWESLDPQRGDDPPTPFSEMTGGGVECGIWNVECRCGARTFHIPHSTFPPLPQVECRITSTNAGIHALIRDNIHRAPMYNGQVESAGPRYCPSIEDKVVRFADRESHHVFLEPESHRDDSVYCNGISTSLPRDVQERIVRGMPGCERAEIIKCGYAVEYDMVRPHQIDATCMTKRFEGLFLAGQINGTSGYEEAAGQGLLAGLNAARFAAGMEPVTLGRDQAYIGVMMDDLVTRTPVEPYRMFTSRAEHRLLLRADNAPDRLTELAHGWGLVCARRQRLFNARAATLAEIDGLIERTRIDGAPLRELVKRPGFSVDDLAAALGSRWPRRVLTSALAERQYAGYITRQQAEIRRQTEMERRRIPQSVSYEQVQGLRREAREALTRFRPATFGQAGRLEGVTPADLSLVLVAMRRGAGAQ